MKNKNLREKIKNIIINAVDIQGTPSIRLGEASDSIMALIEEEKEISWEKGWEDRNVVKPPKKISKPKLEYISDSGYYDNYRDFKVVEALNILIREYNNR